MFVPNVVFLLDLTVSQILQDQHTFCFLNKISLVCDWVMDVYMALQFKEPVLTAAVFSVS